MFSKVDKYLEYGGEGVCLLDPIPSNSCDPAKAAVAFLISDSQSFASGRCVSRVGTSLIFSLLSADGIELPLPANISLFCKNLTRLIYKL